MKMELQKNKIKSENFAAISIRHVAKLSAKSAVLCVTALAAVLAPGTAQAYPIFNLAEIWPTTSTNFSTAVTSVSSFVPGTSIPITVSTSQPIYRRPVDGLLVWENSNTDPRSTGLRNDWTIAVGESSQDVQLTLLDFDNIVTPAGAVALETLSQLNATLGAPTSLVTTGAPGNAQYIYQPSEDGGRILQGTNFPTNVNAGAGVALWEDVNLSTITFTGTRNITNLGQAIDIRIGELPVAPVPEPASWALMLSAAGLAGFARLRRKSGHASNTHKA